MSVVKGHNAATLIKDAIVLDLGDLGRQAAKLQAAADAKAKKTIADAQAEAARIIEAARSKGFEQGRAEGVAAGRAEGQKLGRADAVQQLSSQLKQLTQAWAEAVKRWDARREEIERDAREAVLDLSLHLAEKLVHRVVEVDPTVVQDQLAAALTHVLNPMEVTVEICPADRPVLEFALPELLAEFAHLKHIKLVDDESVTPGGCVVSYGQGQIDATIETQLRRVVELMIPDPAEHADAGDEPTETK